jgi:excinuclease ABC subunit A
MVVDRLIIKKGIRSRLADSVELALHFGDGVVIIKTDDEEKTYSQKLACLKCGISVPEISPRLFSFNSPYGACPECSGLGKKLEIDPDLVVPDNSLSIMEGAIAPFRTSNSNYFMSSFYALARKYKFSLDTPFKKLPKKIQNIILYGTGNTEIEFRVFSDKFTGAYKGTFEGVINNLARRYKETKSEYIRQEIG